MRLIVGIGRGDADEEVLVAIRPAADSGRRACPCRMRSAGRRAMRSISSGKGVSRRCDSVAAGVPASAGAASAAGVSTVRPTTSGSGCGVIGAGSGCAAGAAAFARSSAIAASITSPLITLPTPLSLRSSLKSMCPTPRVFLTVGRSVVSASARIEADRQAITNAQPAGEQKVSSRPDQAQAERSCNIGLQRSRYQCLGSPPNEATRDCAKPSTYASG